MFQTPLETVFETLKNMDFEWGIFKNENQDMAITFIRVFLQIFSLCIGPILMHRAYTLILEINTSPDCIVFGCKFQALHWQKRGTI